MTSRVDHLLDLPHYVYRFYGHDGRLLYVGVTCDISRRMGQHRVTQPWWNEVDVRATAIDVHPDRAAGFAAEARAIASEGPAYNLPTGRRRGHATDEQQFELARLREKADAAEADYRAAVLTMLTEGVSYTVMSEFTGRSTSTLQAWKKEAGR